MNDSSKNVVEAYGEWVAGQTAWWDEAALDSAHRQLIDTVAVMVPGVVEPSPRAVLESVLAWSTGVTRGANVAGNSWVLPAPWAALVNGTAAHALDFDDNFDPAKAHASAVLYPAILALADTTDATGPDVLDAYIVGLQIMGRIGQGVNPVHRNRGWHATSTVGVYGAAAACARLLELDAAKCAHALSLASSMSSGFMSQFGTMAKPLHAGLAAKGGIMAAVMAAHGMEAGRHTLDGPTGMNTLMVGPDRDELKRHMTGAEHGQTLEFELNDIGTPLHITEYGFRVKRFPNCGSAHRAMDLLLALMQEHGFTADDVETIEVHAPKSHLDNLFYHEPGNGLEAKFSMEYAIACLLMTGYCGLGDFTAEAVGRQNLRAQFHKVRLHPVDELESACPTRVALTLHDGRLLEQTAEMPRGSLASPFTLAEYWAKFDACVRGVLTPSQAESLKQALGAFRETVPARQMTRHYAVNYAGNRRHG